MWPKLPWVISYKDVHIMPWLLAWEVRWAGQFQILAKVAMLAFAQILLERHEFISSNS